LQIYEPVKTVLQKHLFTWLVKTSARLTEVAISLASTQVYIPTRP